MIRSLGNRAGNRAGTLAIAALIATWSSNATGQEVIVFGDVQDVISWMKAEDFWGEAQRSEQRQVPYVLLAGISKRWQKESSQLPVPEKKEIFYRAMVPLILHANKMVLDRRERLLALQAAHDAGGSIDQADLKLLRDIAVLLRVTDADSASALTEKSAGISDVINETLYRLDVVPVGLALGQAAYESGYGTSRFAVEGNALFGQWTYGGDGLKPQQQRKELGDHRIAAFAWPFDSVRGYFINLMSHPAYADFRKLRAEAREAGEPLSSMALADGLVNYSERGQEYVDTLKGIIRVNKLDIADNAVLRDEPMRFMIGADDPDAADALRQQIESMRTSGELDDIVRRMRLE